MMSDISKFLNKDISRKNPLLKLSNKKQQCGTSRYTQSLPKYLSCQAISYNSILFWFFAIALSFLLLLPVKFLILWNIIYFLQITSKIFLINKSKAFHEPPNRCSADKKTKIQESDLPKYTILIPAYKEIGKMESIINAMCALNYPTSKMEVKILLEEDDFMTKNFACKLVIPDFIKIVEIPQIGPRTKPKALNFGLENSTGELLVVYDVEDIPDPDQLLEVANEFANLPEKYICLQASLNFYNSDKNILTKLFSIEYSLWFDYILRGLDIFSLPMTLGGTSNHFKLDKLRAIGAWDAFNVTEDAELGLRIYSSGYRAGVISSITMEEAPSNLKTWVMQRVRWIKGFIQTSIIFVKQRKFLEDQGISNLSFLENISVYGLVCATPVIFVLSPWFFALSFFARVESLEYFLFINFCFSCSYMYFWAATAINSFKKSSCKKFSMLEKISILLWPCYFFIHSFSAHLSVLEIIKKPFQWNKTHHPF